MEPNDAVADLDALPVVVADVIAPLYDPDLGGDSSFLAEVIQAFREDSPPRLAALRVACQSGDEDGLTRAAHSLKGSSSNFGAARLQALCAEIERLGHAGQWQAAAPLVDRVQVEYALLLVTLDRLVETTPTGG